MPDSYRLKPYGGPRGGTGAAPESQASHPPLRGARRPPTHSTSGRAEGRTGRTGANPRAGLVHEEEGPVDGCTRARLINEGWRGGGYEPPRRRPLSPPSHLGCDLC